LKDIGISKEPLITLGCFSECWDDNNKPETVKLIQYFLKRGNQIQLATTKEITLEEMERFQNLIQYLGQLMVYVSSATISLWSTIEPGTDEPDKRFNTFKISKQLNIPTVLYMKPILKGITIRDIDLYKKIIKKYSIRDVVVGSIFTEKLSQETVPFSYERLLFYNPNSDELKIKNELTQMGNVRVFSRSSKVAEYYKERSNDLER